MKPDIFKHWQGANASQPHKEVDVIQLLVDNGATDVAIEGTSLKFDYAGLQVDVVSQETRLIGSAHKKPKTDLERRCLEDDSKVFNSGDVEKIEEFINTLNYRQFVFDGQPHLAILDVLELAKMPLERVMELYRIGYVDSGSYGPIRAVGATWARAIGINPK